MKRNKKVIRSITFAFRNVIHSTTQLCKSELSGALCIVYRPKALSWQSHKLFETCRPRGYLAANWKTIWSSPRPDYTFQNSTSYLSWAASSRQVMTSSKSFSFFLLSTLFRCPANRCASSAGNSCPSRDVILTSLTLSLPASASKKSSKYLGSDPRSTWNTTSSASSVQAGLSRILAHPSSSKGDVCTSGAGGRSLGAGPKPEPAPTNRQTAEMLPSDAPAAFSNENTALGGTSSGHNWFKIK